MARDNGPGLIAYFEAEKDKIDRPRPHLIAGGRYKHPASRMRKERILALEDGHEITWKTELCLSSNFFVRHLVRIFDLSDPYAEETFRPLAPTCAGGFGSTQRPRSGRRVDPLICVLTQRTVSTQISTTALTKPSESQGHCPRLLDSTS